MQKRGVPRTPPPTPGLSKRLPHNSLSSCGARTRAHAGHTHPTPERGSAASFPPARKTPGAAAPTYPATRTPHPGPRTAAASCRTWSRAGRCHYLVRAAVGTDLGGPDTQFPGAPPSGWRQPQATCAPPRLKGVATWAVWARPRCHRGQPCPGPSLHGPRTGPDLRASCRRSVASDACSLSAG